MLAPVFVYIVYGNQMDMQRECLGKSTILRILFTNMGKGSGKPPMGEGALEKGSRLAWGWQGLQLCGTG